MSESRFEIREHVIPTQHIREYPNGIRRGAESQLRLAVKEYRPRDNIPAHPGSVTLIAAHANGCPKECYEPLWDDLLQALEEKPKVHLRAIWIADATNQGSSGVLNEQILGDDPSWFDHSRDLLYMINHFRDLIPEPIMAVGHSMGADHLIQLSIIHPRLLHSLAMIEPVNQTEILRPNAALASSLRKDVWPSREIAESSIRKARFYGSWDPRALEKYLQYGLRSVPTAVYPDAKSGVTLTTTKAQEVWGFMRSNFSFMEDPVGRSEQLKAPDVSQEYRKHLFHRPEMVLGFQRLANIRPHVLWIFGQHSHLNKEKLREEKLRLTGIGPGGSGGVDAGRAEAITITEGEHMVPLQRTKEVANILSSWLDKQLEDYRFVVEWHKSHDRGMSQGDGFVLSEAWMKNVRKDQDSPRPVKGRL